MKSKHAIIVLTSLSAILAMQSNAASVSWKGVTDANWDTLTNWSTGAVPGTGDSIFFDANSTANLSNSLGATNYSIQCIFANSGLTGDVAIASTGGVLTLNTYGIGWYGGVTKNLSISANVATGTATQAWWAESGTTVALSGTTALNCSMSFRGSNASSSALNAGTFVFSNNVTVASGKGVVVGTAGYDGNLAITAGTFDSTLGSDWIVGDNGGNCNGTLTISGSGTLKFSTNNTLYVGYSYATATVTISGSGTLEAATNTQTIILGLSNATGTLNLDGGTLFTSRSIRGSNLGGGTGTVNFNGGTLKAKDGDNANWLLSASTFNAYVKGSATPNSGAVIDSNSYNMGTSVALQHYAAGPATDGGLTKNGAGTLTLGASNTYTGATTINGGTLALGAGGALHNASSISIAAGATFDVSGLGASATYTLGSSASLAASGTASPATLVGGVSGTVSLGSQPVKLTWGGASSGIDSTHPALTVSQGTLALGGNQLTVVTATALDVGVYTLITAPAITGTVNAIPLFTGGSGVSGSNVGVVSISGNSVILTVSAPTATITPSGTLSAVSTTYGTASDETSFSVSGSDLSAGILVAPPAGYEVSETSGSGYTGSGVSITVGSAPTVPSTTVYVRLAATSPVTGTYNSQNITLSSPGAITVTVPTAATGNNVSAKALTVASTTAHSKLFDANNSASVTATLQAAEDFGSGSSGDGMPYTGDDLSISCSGSTFASSAVGNGISVNAGTFTLGGAAAANYTLTQPTGLSLSADILASPLWAVDNNGLWSDATNWLSEVIPDGIGVPVDFNTTFQSFSTTVTLDSNRSVGSMTFGNANAIDWTLDQTGGSILTMSTAAGAPAITVLDHTTTISAALAGNQGLTKFGDGTLILSGANTYSGATTVDAGILKLQDLDAMSMGNVTIGSGATLEFANSTRDFSTNTARTYSGAGTMQKTGNSLWSTWSGAQTFAFDSGALVDIQAGEVRLQWGGSQVFTNNKADLTVAAGATLNLWDNFTVGGVIFDGLNGGGAITRSGISSGKLTIGVDGGGGTFSGVISNASGTTHLIKSGSGHQTLSGNNTYTGMTTVTAGTLLLTGSIAGPATVETTGTLAGNGTVGGAAIIDATGILSPGNSDVNTLQFSSTLTLNADSTYAVSITSATTNDKVAASGNLTANGTIKVTLTGYSPVDGNTFDLADAASISGTPTFDFTAATLDSGLTWDTSSFTTNGTIQVVSSGTTYNGWMDGFTFAEGADKTPTGDPDGDGISNSIEMVLGGNPATGMDTALMPTIGMVTDPSDSPAVPAGNYLLFTYRRSDASVSAGVTAVCATNNDLGITWTEATIASGAYIRESELTPPVVGIKEVRVYVPRASNTKLFGRLQVTAP